jgi:DNA-binding transcriptional regulator/RsmH inhibitor MraZ
MSDSPLSDSKKQEWATYRQELRDLPSLHQSANNIADVIFPSIPE